MVYLQAAVNAEGPAAKVVRAVEDDHLLLFVSDAILAEVRDVLNRPVLRQKFPSLTEERAETLVQFLQVKGNRIINVPETFRYERDPKDEKYVNLALVTDASFLVSHDSDLLDLMDERRQAGKAFRTRFPLLRILDPVAMLDILFPRSENEE